MAEVTIDSSDIARFAKQLRAVDDKKVKALMNKRLKAVAAEGVDAARSAALAIPTGGGSGRAHRGADKQRLGPLRPILSAAIRPAFRSAGREAGVSIRVSRAYLKNRSGAEKVLEYGGRHPVFGKEPWVPQAPTPWFYRALEPWLEKGSGQLDKVIDDISRELGFH